MAFQKIAINSFEDYLLKVKDFAVANGWLLEFYGISTYTGNNRLILKNSDSSVYVGWDLEYSLSGGEKKLNESKIVCNVFELYDNPTSSLRNQLGAYYGIDGAATFSFPDEKNCMLYIHVNAGRIITCSNSGDAFGNFMGGKYTGYGSPIQQPNQYFFASQSVINSFQSSMLNLNSYKQMYFNFMGTYGTLEETYPYYSGFSNIMGNYDDTTYSLIPIVFKTRFW